MGAGQKLGINMHSTNALPVGPRGGRVNVERRSPRNASCSRRDASHVPRLWCRGNQEVMNQPERYSDEGETVTKEVFFGLVPGGRQQRAWPCRQSTSSRRVVGTVELPQGRLKTNIGLLGPRPGPRTGAGADLGASPSVNEVHGVLLLTKITPKQQSPLAPLHKSLTL